MSLKSNIRVIGGKYRGLGLEMRDSPTTRPTKSILKESLFNVLQGEIEGRVFIEGFGGSGSVGIEALSRGAEEAIFVEYDSLSLEVLRKNLSKLKECKARSYLGDSFALLPQILEEIEEEGILYLDPPFCIRENMQDIYQKCFAMVEKIQNPQIFLVIFEHLSTYEMPKTLGNFCIIKAKKFGKSTLSYYVKESKDV